MARISTYAIDTNVTSQDKWIGTDSNGSVTKNFTPQGVANWINSTNAVGIVGQINFRFQSVLATGRASGTISFDEGGGIGTNFSDISTIKISKYGSGGKLIIDYLNNLVGRNILICQVDDVNKFGVYEFNSLTKDLVEADFYNAVITNKVANGALAQDQYYGIVIYPDAVLGPPDSHYVFTQVGAAQTWEIVHNLSKFPSVSVVDSANNIVMGDVIYNSENQLTITFTSAFSGKAYLN